MAKIIGFEIHTKGSVDFFYAMDEDGQLWKQEVSNERKPHELKWEKQGKPVIEPKPPGEAGTFRVDTMSR